LTVEQIIRTAPKVLLHDHLDGGLRPQTIINLAKDLRYNKLPTKDPVVLGEWFHRGANKGNLVEYLQGFEHTTAVMQTKEALEQTDWVIVKAAKLLGTHRNSINNKLKAWNWKRPEAPTPQVH